MINNYCNQENDVYFERSADKTLTADKAVSDLSEEQLRDVLEQLTDHNLPDSEKCPLVRRLNEENASKDESGIVIPKSQKTPNPSSSNTCRNNRKPRSLQRSGSKDAEFTREKSNGSTIKAVHSSQSLQDLMSSANAEDNSKTMRAIGANRTGKRLNKTTRANSFTSGAQHFCNNNNIKENFSEVLSSTDLRTSGQSQNSSKGTRNKNLKPRPTQNISIQTVTASNAGIKSDDESALISSTGVSEPTISSRTLNECFATQSVYTDNHNMDSCDKNCTPLYNSSVSAAEQHLFAETEYIELKDLRQKAEIVEYRSGGIDSPNRTSNEVDSFINLNPSLNPKEPNVGVAQRIHNSYDYDSKDFISNTSEDNRLMQFQGSDSISSLNPNQDTSDLNLANSPHSLNQTNKDSQSRNASNKKKKKPETQFKMSEQIEGHIGFKDVEHLVAFVNSSGNESEVNPKSNGTLINNSNLKESVKKKEKSFQLVSNSVSKRKNGSIQSTSAHKNSVSPNIPLSTSSSSFSGDEANSVSKHSDFAQRTDSLTHETTSPLNSSSDKTVLNREDSDQLDDDNVSNSAINSSFSLMSSNMSADLLYTASDSEMPDREKGFVTPKSKHLKRRKGLLRRFDNNRRNQRSPNRSMQSSTSTTPSSSTVSGAAGYERYSGFRGYESEREYTDDYQRKPHSCSGGRRKSLSSVPHSEHNSAYNSDGELSSHSMPVRNDSLNTEKSNSESRTTPSSVSSTPKASYADIAKTLSFGITYPKRASIDGLYTSNATIGPLPVQYQDFPQLDLSLPPVVDVSAPSSPNNSKIIEALVSPQQKSVADKRDTDSYSAPTSMANTPIPQNLPQNECLFSETVKDSTSNVETTETSDLTVPAVIMCDYSESVPISDIGSVTFGFFDDLSANSGQNSDKTQINAENSKSPELKTEIEFQAKSPIKTSPEVKSHLKSASVSAVEMSYIDVDKKSFNYEHIICFIKNAWDNAKRDYTHTHQSYESSPTVK